MSVARLPAFTALAANVTILREVSSSACPPAFCAAVVA
jgi:hypothetical protein